LASQTSILPFCIEEKRKAMTSKREPIGDRYQKETKYFRDSIGGSFLDWDNKPNPYKEYPDAKNVVRLPLSSTQDGPGIWEVLCRRRSERDFISSPITLQELSQLIFATQGVTAKREGYLFRTAPSAGALYPVETYLLVNRVENLSGGLYHFNVLKNCLEMIREEDLAGQLTMAALGQPMVLESAVIFIWTAIVSRSKWKYGERAYRYIYMDAGHIGQNLYLASAALNVGCCTIGALFDDEVNEILGVDGIEETVVYMGVVGQIS
jgi:SagB-type dehydrogenase family enzyme